MSLHNYLFFTFHFIFLLFRAAPAAYVGSQARGLIGVTALAYTTVSAMPDLSHIFELYHSSRQHRILNPLSKARDGTHNLMVPGQIHFRCAMMGTPHPLLDSKGQTMGLFMDSWDMLSRREPCTRRQDMGPAPILPWFPFWKAWSQKGWCLHGSFSPRLVLSRYPARHSISKGLREENSRVHGSFFFF